MNNNNQNKQDKQIGHFFDKMALVVVLSSFIVFFYLLMGWSNGSFLSQKAFDSDSWKEADRGWINWQPSLRKSMVNDLIESKSLNNLSMSQVEELLGVGRILTIHNGKRITYFLGPLSFNLGADDRLYLCVEFEKNRVSRLHVFEGV